MLYSPDAPKGTDTASGTTPGMKPPSREKAAADLQVNVAAFTVLQHLPGVSLWAVRSLYHRPSTFRSRSVEWEETVHPDTGLQGLTTEHTYSPTRGR